MTDAECDFLLKVAGAPQRRMRVSAMSLGEKQIAARLVRDDGPLKFFHGGWVALTDKGYDDMIIHCGENF